MLELKIVDESRAAQYAVLEHGQRIGEIAHETSEGRSLLRLRGREYAICRDGVVDAAAPGRLLRAVWQRLQPAQQYSVMDGDQLLARIECQGSLLRSGPIVLRAAGAMQAWRVPTARGIPSRLKLFCDDGEAGELQIPGLLRERILLPPLPLDAPLVLALAWVVHRGWGNDPYRES